MIRPRDASDESPDHLSLSDLVDHIVAVHHGYLRRHLPLIERDIDEALNDPDGLENELLEIRDLYHAVSGEIFQHLIREEQVIFPLIRQLEYAQRRPEHYSGGLSVSIRDLEHEHESFTQEMHRVRELTNNYHAPARAGEPIQRLFRRLADLERDMVEHTRLEDDVLIPRATEIRSSLTAHEPHPEQGHFG
jgi:regulator of cell morphogenesis and NO signaling